MAAGDGYGELELALPDLAHGPYRPFVVADADDAVHEGADLAANHLGQEVSVLETIPPFADLSIGIRRRLGSAPARTIPVAQFVLAPSPTTTGAINGRPLMNKVFCIHGDGTA